MPRVTDALLDAGFTELQIEKLWGLNFQRVLQDGWGR
jgi:microsomal dipeptidase-like Zn-dependent dipeptidase